MLPPPLFCTRVVACCRFSFFIIYFPPRLIRRPVKSSCDKKYRYIHTVCTWYFHCKIFFQCILTQIQTQPKQVLVKKDKQSKNFAHTRGRSTRVRHPRSLAGNVVAAILLPLLFLLLPLLLLHLWFCLATGWRSFGLYLLDQFVSTCFSRGGGKGIRLRKRSAELLRSTAEH